MCFNRNSLILSESGVVSLNDWDMCFNRNIGDVNFESAASLNDWDMCFNRNLIQEYLPNIQV